MRLLKRVTRSSVLAKALLFVVFVISLSLLASAQTATEPTVLAKSIEMTNPGTWQIYGEPGRPVQVKIGSATITADEVGILQSPDGVLDWEFHGFVHMKSPNIFKTR